MRRQLSALLLPLPINPQRLMHSASLITRDLDKTVEFYIELPGYKVLGRSEITAEKSRHVVGAKGTRTVQYVTLARVALQVQVFLSLRR